MHALSLPTWWIHVASVLEWVLAMAAVIRWGERRGETEWRWLALAMLPALVSAMAACTWHLFDNPGSSRVSWSSRPAPPCWATWPWQRQPGRCYPKGAGHECP